MDPTKAIRYLSARRPVPLYHGTSAKDASQYIRAMSREGIVPRIRNGFGQGGGYYAFTDRGAAATHARAVASGAPDFRISRPRDGIETPIIVSLNASLNPRDYDIDYEVQSGDAMSFLASQEGIINERLGDSPVMAEVSAIEPLPLHGMYIHPNFKKDPNAGIGFWIQDPKSIDMAGVAYNDDTNIYLRGGNIYDAADLSGIIRALGESAPDVGRDWAAYKRAIMKRQAEGRAAPRAYKYIGDKPITPSGVFVRGSAGWQNKLLDGLLGDAQPTGGQ